MQNVLYKMFETINENQTSVGLITIILVFQTKMKLA